MDISLKSKFSMGDIVYTIESYEDYKDKTKCNLCLGEGEIVVARLVSEDDESRDYNLEEYECPICEGNGEIYDTNEKIKQFRLSHKSPAEIDGISIYIGTRDTTINYGLTRGPFNAKTRTGFWSSRAEEANCFTTLEEAQAEVIKRNADPYNDEWRCL